jgi:hypothetical protein
MLKPFLVARDCPGALRSILTTSNAFYCTVERPVR